MYEWSKEELERIGWAYCSDAMKLYEENPDIWESMILFVRNTVNPAKTTDTYMAVRMDAYIHGYLASREY